MALWTWSLAILLLQGPGDGWALVQAPPREVKRVYWELFQTTEVWLQLIPEHRDGKPPLVSLVFQAFFPGRADRNPYSGLPQEPKGPPARLVLKAQPLPLTIVRELSLRFVIDGKAVDLAGPDGRHRNLPCLVASDGCTPYAIEAELEPSVLRSLITAQAVLGQVLGFPIELTKADQQALAEFADRTGLREESPGR